MQQIIPRVDDQELNELVAQNSRTVMVERFLKSESMDQRILLDHEMILMDSLHVYRFGHPRTAKMPTVPLVGAER
jgi:hypothetical protein